MGCTSSHEQSIADDTVDAAIKDVNGERRTSERWCANLCLWLITTFLAYLWRKLRNLSCENDSDNVPTDPDSLDSKDNALPACDTLNKQNPLKRARNSVEDYTTLDAYFLHEPEKPSPLSNKKRDLGPKKEDQVMLTGLKNLGNTCYMNSTIQCLNYTSPLIKYFITDSYLRDIHRNKRGELVDEFAYIVKALWSGNCKCFSPKDFKMVMGRDHPTVAGCAQQDSFEFLTFLMDGLHDGINKVKVKSQIPEQDNARLSEEEAAEISWRDHKLHNESIIVELFHGQFKMTIMCTTCSEKTVDFETFMYLLLPIPNKKRCTLNDCLCDFFAEKSIPGNFLKHKSNCSTKSNTFIKKDIWKPPNILFIVLKRFEKEAGRTKKIKRHVDFQTSGMNISKFVVGPGPKTYELYAVSNHVGELASGHYTACCKNPCNQKWYKFNDEHVYDTTESETSKTCGAYVLYYTSIDQQRYSPAKPKQTKRK